MLQEHINLAINSIFVENILLAFFLGMCSYLAVSKKVSTAIGLQGCVSKATQTANGLLVNRDTTALGIGEGTGHGFARRQSDRSRTCPDVTAGIDVIAADRVDEELRVGGVLSDRVRTGRHIGDGRRLAVVEAELRGAGNIGCEAESHSACRL